MIFRLIAASLLLASSSLYAEEDTQVLVHFSSFEDGTSKFIYIRDDRLLVANYHHDPLGAFWKEVPEWTERKVTLEEIDSFIAVVSGIVADWDVDYNGLQEGEKVCQDFAWGVKIDSPQLIFDSSGICKEPENFQELVAEVMALISNDESE